MKYYIDLLARSRLFFMIIYLLLIIILVFLSIIIKRFINDVFKLYCITYLIYFPIGIFMSVYYWIVTKELFTRENKFSFGFLVCTFFMIMLGILRVLVKSPRLEKFRLNKYNYNDRRYDYTKDYLDFRFEVCIFFGIYMNIFIMIYTFFNFGNLLITWVK